MRDRKRFRERSGGFKPLAQIRKTKQAHDAVIEERKREHDETGHTNWRHSGWSHSGWSHSGWRHSDWRHRGWRHSGWSHSGWSHNCWRHCGWSHSGGACLLPRQLNYLRVQGSKRVQQKTNEVERNFETEWQTEKQETNKRKI